MQTLMSVKQHLPTNQCNKVQQLFKGEAIIRAPFNQVYTQYAKQPLKLGHSFYGHQL